MEHTCMTGQEIADRVASIDAGGGHCLGFKFDKLANDRRQSEESCKTCQLEKVKKQKEIDEFNRRL